MNKLMKKFTALMLACFMCITMVSSVYATDGNALFEQETNVNSSEDLEYILDSYHAQVLDQAMGLNGTAAVYADDMESYQSNNILEETVSKLKSSGYEAYSVTPETYVNVQTELNTDLNSIGLSRDGSYIVVTDTADPESTISPYSTKGNSYNYTYNGKTYKLRSLTITAADTDVYLKIADPVNLINSKSKDIIVNAMNATLSAAADAVSGKLKLGTLASILGVGVSDVSTNNKVTLNLNFGASWTRKFTQVYDSSHKTWVSGSSVEYVYANAYLSGQYYNATKNKVCKQDSKEVSKKFNSSKYSNASWQKKQGVIGYIHSVVNYDTTGSVYAYYNGKKKVTIKETL